MPTKEADVNQNREPELDDDMDAGPEGRSLSAPCSQKRIKPMVVALAVAFLVVVCFMICNPGRPSSRMVANAVHEGPEDFVTLLPQQAPQTQVAQGSAVAWKYVAQTYVCPKCGWQGNRMALDELGNCVCPSCGYCSFKKNVRTSKGVDAIASASPNLSVVKPIGVEVKDMLGGVAACAVYGNSWAEKAGMKQGDFIVRFNHEDIVYVNQLMDVVAKAPPEKHVPVTVIRKGKKVKFDVWVGEGEMEGVVVPAPAAAAGWGFGFRPGQGNMQGGYAVCPGCGFRMLCQRGQACPLCPRCNNYMMSETAGNGAAAFQRGQGQLPWCPPIQGAGAAYPSGSGQNTWCPPR